MTAHRVLTIILLAFSFVIPHSLEGATLHVSTRGTAEGIGSAAAPFLSIQSACDQAVGGDTILVAAGVYTEKITFRVSGTADTGLITLKGEKGAVLSGKNVRGTHMVSLHSCSFIRIENLEIRDLTTAYGSAIHYEGGGSHLEFVENTIHAIHGNDAAAITIYGTSQSIPVSNVTVHKNHIYDCQPAQSETVTLNGNVTDFKVTENIIHDVNNIGIDFIGGEQSVIKDNTKVARSGVCSGNTVSRVRANYGGGYAAGIYVDGGQDILIENNDVSQCDLGIEIGAENKGMITKGITVKGNRIYGNDKAGIVFGGYDAAVGRVESCKIIDNFCYNNATHQDAVGELWIQYAANNTIQGNTFFAGKKNLLLYSEAGNKNNQIAGNIWYAPAGSDGSEFTWNGATFMSLSTFQKASGTGKGARFSRPTLPRTMVQHEHDPED